MRLRNCADPAIRWADRRWEIGLNGRGSHVRRCIDGFLVPHRTCGDECSRSNNNRDGQFFHNVSFLPVNTAVTILTRKGGRIRLNGKLFAFQNRPDETLPRGFRTAFFGVVPNGSD